MGRSRGRMAGSVWAARVVLALIVGLVPAWATAASAPLDRGTALLDPADHVSPSGAYVLHVEPTDRRGKGPADVTLRHEDTVVWQARLPFTFWGAVVMDDGRVAGYAYTEGLDAGRERGDLVVAILARDGTLAFEEVTPRTTARALHFPPDPRISGLVWQPELGRVIVRVEDTDVNRGIESWWCYDLDRLERTATIELRDALPPDDHLRGAFTVRPVPGTPLLLAHWYRVAWPDLGARFSLHDADGTEVWSRTLEDDYSSVEADYSSDEENEARTDVLREMWEGGGVLATGPSSFDVRCAREAACVSYSVERDSEETGAWLVTERGWRPLEGGDDPTAAGLVVVGDGPGAEQAAEVRPLDLRLVSSVALGAAVEGRDVRDVMAVDAGDDGALRFIRREDGERVYSAVAVDEAGRRMRLSSFEPLAPGEGGRVTWTPLGGGEWLATFSPFAEGASARAWRTLDGATRLVPLPAFKAPPVDAVAPCGDGGFVLLATREAHGQLHQVLVACAADGSTRWTRHEDYDDVESIFSPQDVTVLADGSVVVLEGVRNDLKVYDRDGGYVRTVGLAEAWGRTPKYVASIALDAGGGLLIEDFDVSPPLVRMTAEGAVRGEWSPRFPDGRAPRALVTSVSPASDGRLWTTDGHALLRLDAEAVVDLVVGAPADEAVLEDPGSGLVSSSGRVLLQDRRDAAVHVFDASGAHLVVCRPEVAEFPQGADWGTGLAESGSGVVCIELPEEDGASSRFAGAVAYATFDTQGVRTGTRALGPDAVFVPGTGSWWRTAGFRTRVERCDPDGSVTTTVGHAPDGTWLRYVRSLAVAPDGSLAILQDRSARSDRRGSIALYRPDGTPSGTIVLPDGLRPHDLAYGDGWLALGALESVLHLVRLADASVHAAEVDLPFAQGSLWQPAFSPDGDEVWWLDSRRRTLHRFALPEGS